MTKDATNRLRGKEKVKTSLFVLLLYVLVNCYGHGGTVSSPNHTFYWASLNKRLNSNLCTYFHL